MSRRLFGTSIAAACLAIAMTIGAGSPSRAADCSVTAVGFVPLNDLGTGLYLGTYQGGLYPGGSNAPPAAHFAEGRARALAIEPLDNFGNPDPSGTMVLLSIGMSNTTQEFCSAGGGLPCSSWTFMGKAATDFRVNHSTLTIVNGALGGQAAATWDDPSDGNYNRVRDTVLAPQGLTEAQVQAVWIKVAEPGPTMSLPSPAADAIVLEQDIGEILRAVGTRYPNCRIAFLSTRIYAGYAGYPVPLFPLNPEPYSYENGFSAKWVIEAQIAQAGGGGIDPIAGDLDYNTVAPWVAWGPYLWADGTTPRSDGLTYVCGDLDGDGTHPSMTGEEKVGQKLLNFMLTSRFATPWFRRCESGDMNHDGLFDGRDIQLFVTTFLNPPAAPLSLKCPADCSDDGVINPPDLAAFISVILAG